MKKKMILRGLLGAPLGIAISYMITVIISMCIGDGNFYPVPPVLIEVVGNELDAVLLQTLLSCIVGAAMAIASIIWDIDTWSLAKQTGIYFAIICVIMFPISYVAGWMPHTLLGVILYGFIFVVIFLVAWIFQYFTWKVKIKQLNNKVK